MPGEDDMRLLCSYDWPGNIRELSSVIEQARSHIEAALRKSRGRVDGPFGAALLLGLNPQTLRSRMRKLGIDSRRFSELR